MLLLYTSLGNVLELTWVYLVRADWAISLARELVCVGGNFTGLFSGVTVRLFIVIVTLILDVLLLMLVPLRLRVEDLSATIDSARERFVMLSFVVVEHVRLVENLPTAREHALSFKVLMFLAVDEKLSIRVETGFAIELYADIGVGTTVHLQVVVKVSDADKLPATILTDHFLVLHFQEAFRLFVVTVVSNVYKQIFEVLEPFSAIWYWAYIFLN